MCTPTRGEIPRGKPDGLDILTARWQLGRERVRYHAEAGPEIVANIDRGVLFLMAFWSITAFQSFRALRDVLTRLRADALEVVVIDVDGSPEVYSIPEFFGRVHGCGEVAWVRDGRIVAASGIGLNPQCYEPNTRDLLAMP